MTDTPLIFIDESGAISEVAYDTVRRLYTTNPLAVSIIQTAERPDPDIWDGVGAGWITKPEPPPAHLRNRKERRRWAAKHRA